MRERKNNEKRLLKNLKRKLPELQKLLKSVNSHWSYEDPVYRFYYQSLKVYFIQNETRQISDLLFSLAPKGCDFCEEFKSILKIGANRKLFKMSHNRNWSKHTRPMVEAFFHAKFFLEMAVKYGEELDQIPEVLPSGWAALLCLYGLR